MHGDGSCRSSMSLLSLLVWTVVVVGVASSVKELGQLAVAAISIGLYVTVVAAIVRQVAPLWQTFKLTLPLAVPLVLVHGVLNPTFGRTDAWLGVPIRFDGFVFGAIVSLRVLVLAFAAVLWSIADTQRLFWDAVRWRIPLPLITSLALGASTARSIRRRAVSVLMAQQARGIPVHGNVIQRARALVAVVIPVVIATLVESAKRGEILAIRGFGSRHPTCPPSLAGKWRTALECVGALMALMFTLAA